MTSVRAAPERARTGRNAAIAEIAPGVYEIRLTRVRAHVVAGDGLTLIDTGLARSGPAIARAIEALGWSVDDVTRIVCTHGHPDHAGGAAELLRDDIELFMHPADFANLPITLAEAVRRPSRGRLFAAMTPMPSRATPIVDGDVLPVLGGLEVIHTPGHTPGSVCLYARRQRLLFVGDALQARFGRVTFASRLYSDDYELGQASVRRLADLDVETIIFSHYPPLKHDANRVLQRLASRVPTKGGTARCRR
jgi:glyoxylase-like metal-dependent hydrolase (beta-lactamase superfamily II)